MLLLYFSPGLGHAKHPARSSRAVGMLLLYFSPGLGHAKHPARSSRAVGMLLFKFSPGLGHGIPIKHHDNVNEGLGTSVLDNASLA
jgi:hypothetical protein